MIHFLLNLRRTASIDNNRRDINRDESCTIHKEESNVDSCLWHEAISRHKHA